MVPGRPHGPLGITLGAGSEGSSGFEQPAIAQIATPSPPTATTLRAPRRSSRITPTLSSDSPRGASDNQSRAAVLAHAGQCVNRRRYSRPGARRTADRRAPRVGSTRATGSFTIGRWAVRWVLEWSVSRSLPAVAGRTMSRVATTRTGISRSGSRSVMHELAGAVRVGPAAATTVKLEMPGSTLQRCGFDWARLPPL